MTRTPLSHLFLAAAIATAASGCAPASSDPDAIARAAEVDSAITELQAKQAEMAKTLSFADSMVRFALGQGERDKDVFLTPGADGYSEVDAGIGTLTVRVVDVKSFASGSRATIAFGNPTSANITSLKMKVEYGPLAEGEAYPDLEAKKSRDWSISATTRAGRWTRHDVTLEGVKPESIGFISLIGVSANGIELAGNP